jgi:Predicted nucleoside-diphosphate sugar epimerases
MKDILELVGRETDLFSEDIILRERKIEDIVSRSSFLVLGASGSIGQAVTKEIFRRGPAKLHVVDISENNIVELVRDLRSEYGYIDGDFRSYVLDVGSTEYEAFFKADGKYDYVLNLSALKHVRSEKDPYTLMRMINVNIFNTNRTLELAIKSGVKKYFCVSTDKAANPVNMMGASKRIMEMFLSRFSKEIDISTARFANVAFSDGSLLYSFRNRLLKKQPIVAPNDVRRYFLTPQESGELCLMSCLFGKNGDVFFQNLMIRSTLLPFLKSLVVISSSKAMRRLNARVRARHEITVSKSVTLSYGHASFHPQILLGKKILKSFSPILKLWIWNDFVVSGL